MDLVLAMAFGAGAVCATGCTVDLVAAYWRADRSRQAHLAGAFMLHAAATGAFAVVTLFFLARAIVASLGTG
jgi:hypothetical protein